MTRLRTVPPRTALVLVVGVMLAASPEARQGDANALRDDLRQRYDILALQDGVGLVPRGSGRDVRLIEIRDGAVFINGDTVTGRELRDRVGRDADLVLRVSYLTAAEQRRLAESAAPLPSAAPSMPGAPAPPPLPGVVEPPDPPEPPDIPRSVRRGGDVVRIVGNVTIARDERVEGDVVVVLGNAYIDGEVDGEVTVVMGNAYLGNESVVRDDVNVIGGMLNRAGGARVEGTIDNVSIGAGPWPRPNVGGFLRDTIGGRIGSLAGTLIRIGLLALFSLIVVAFAGTSIERIADRTAEDPLRAGLVGFFAQLVFFPLLVITCIVLAISIIGIPLLLLLPFAIFGAIVMCLVGFTGVAYQAGRWLNARVGWTDRSPYATVLVGIMLIALVTILARSAAVAGGTFFTFPLVATGFFVEYLAWTLGMGAVILAWLQRRRSITPPPLPAA
jgi:hypothetical protein